MISYKRLIHLSLFLGIVLAVGLYHYHNMMANGLVLANRISHRLMKQKAKENSIKKLVCFHQAIIDIDAVPYQPLVKQVNNCLDVVHYQQQLYKQLDSLVIEVKNNALDDKSFESIYNAYRHYQEFGASRWQKADEDEAKLRGDQWIQLTEFDKIGFTRLLPKNQFLNQFENMPVEIIQLLLLEIRYAITVDTELLIERFITTSYCGPDFNWNQNCY